MTYEQVAALFERFERASTWPSENPERFHFCRNGNERVLYLSKDDGQASYLWVPLDEVCDHVEPSGRTDSQNVYYRLKRAA